MLRWVFTGRSGIDGGMRVDNTKDLISREALIKKIFPYGMPDDGNYPINAKAVRKAIEEAPSVEKVNNKD